MKAKAASNQQTKWSFVSLPALRKTRWKSLSPGGGGGLSSLGYKEELTSLPSLSFLFFFFFTEFLNTMFSLTVASPTEEITQQT